MSGPLEKSGGAARRAAFAITLSTIMAFGGAKAYLA
jgi:hypothetical protein